MMNKKFSANGVQGVLLIYPDLSKAVKTGEKDKFGHEILKCDKTIVVFRVYNYDKIDEMGNMAFKDYDVLCNDCKIELKEGILCETDEGNFLDIQ